MTFQKALPISLFLVFSFGLAIAVCTGCSPNQAGWNVLRDVRLFMQNNDDKLPKRATQAGLDCINKSQQAHQVKRCAQRNHTIQAAMAWNVMGRKMMQQFYQEYVLALMVADKTRSKVDPLTYREPIVCVARAFLSQWPTAFPKDELEIVKRIAHAPKIKCDK